MHPCWIKYIFLFKKIAVVHFFSYCSICSILPLLKGSYYALLQSLDFVLGVYYMLSCLVVRKSHNFSHNLHYYNTFLLSLAQTARFDEGPPSEKQNVLWLVSCPSALWLANSLDQGCQTQFLEGHSPAEFSSNPAPTHIPCSFQISLNDLISWIRCV